MYSSMPGPRVFQNYDIIFGLISSLNRLALRYLQIFGNESSFDLNDINAAVYLAGIEFIIKLDEGCSPLTQGFCWEMWKKCPP